MDIDGICHSAFCGRLEARFPGRAILYTTCPGLGLAKPDKSRLFSLLTVHSRPPFPFTFCFSAACELWRHSRGSILPGWIWGRTHRRRPHSVSSPYPGKSPLPASRPAARPPQRNHLQQTEKEIVCGQVQVSPSSRTMQLPSSQQQHSRRIRLAACFLCAGGHAVKGTVRPAFQRRQVFIGVISHAFPPFCFPLPFSPKRFPAPFLRRVPALARSPQLRDILGLLTKWENIICCGRIKEKAGGGLDATEAAHGNDRGSDAAGTLPSEAGGSTGSVFVYEETSPLYSRKYGRPPIDPVVLVKYLLVGFLYGIPSERQIEQRVQTDVALRWYLGLDLFDRVPDHSTISQLRRRKPSFRKVFRRLFEEVVRAMRRRRSGQRTVGCHGFHPCEGQRLPGVGRAGGNAGRGGRVLGAAGCL